MLAQVLECFGDVQPFHEQLTFSPAAHQHLIPIPHNPAESQVLQLELAATVDVGNSFVQNTYVMEGDGEGIADAYDNLQELSFTMAEPCHPNTLAVAKKQEGDNQAQVPILMTQSRGYVADAIRYFRQHMNHQDGDFYPIMQMFKAV